MRSLLINSSPLLIGILLMISTGDLGLILGLVVFIALLTLLPQKRWLRKLGFVLVLPLTILPLPLVLWGCAFGGGIGCAILPLLLITIFVLSLVNIFRKNKDVVGRTKFEIGSGLLILIMLLLSVWLVLVS